MNVEHLTKKKLSYNEWELKAVGETERLGFGLWDYVDVYDAQAEYEAGLTCYEFTRDANNIRRMGA